MSIIAVWGSPRSGKTEIALALAYALTEQGNIVGMISAEDYPEMAAKLGIQNSPGKGIVPAVSFGSNISQCAVEVKKGMGLFLLAGMPADSTFDLTFGKEQAERILKSSEDLYDIVIVDCTTSKQNAISGEALAMATHIIMPIPGQVEAKYWHDANKQILDGLHYKTRYIRNCTEKRFNYSLLEELIGCRPFSSIPFCSDLQELRAEGKGLIDKGGKYKRAVNTLVQGVEP